MAFLRIEGNFLKMVLQKASLGERLKEVCDQFPDEKMVGFYEFISPALVIKDAEYVEAVLIKDFPHFVDRGFEVDEKTNPLDVSIATMTGKRWRAYRNKLSPIFTTGKLKSMYGLMTDVGDNLMKAISREKKECLELKDVLGRFAMDVIGSFAFGMDANTLADPESKFRKMGKNAVDVNFQQFLRLMIITNFPKLSKKYGLSLSPKDIQDYFGNVIKDTINYRMEKKVRRNDFLDLMLQLREKGSVEITTKDPSDDYLAISNETYSTDKFEVTDDLMVGQAFVFLTAGFETTAILMNMTFYELSKNPEIQERVRKDINEKVREHGSLSFDSVKDMSYLDMCLKETLRKYPPAQMLLRTCTKEYTFPNGLVVKPGERLIIPVFAIHRSDEYYPDPDKFDPERFGPDVFQRPCTFLPFGEGPRVCIGNSWRNILKQTSQGERFKEICDKFPDDKIIGMYDFLQPILVVKDVEVVEAVLVKDFPHFVDHGFDVDENTNPMDINLFSMTGKRWRAYRNRLSPIFTTGKLKTMYGLMTEIGENLVNAIEKESTDCVDLKDVLGRFSTDVIGNFAFGFDPGTLADPKSEFRTMGKKVFEFNAFQILKYVIIFNFPSLAKKLGLSINNMKVQDYFVNIIKDTIVYRVEKNFRRNDFLDLMLQLREKGSVEITTKDPSDDYLEIGNNTYTTEKFEVTDNLMVGQAFTFLTAGFDTTAAIMDLVCYEFSKNPEIQERARNEVKEKVRHHGKLSFDSVKDMTYLDMCLKETMRKYPPVPMLMRICTKEYTFDNGLTVYPGDKLFIPLYSIHMDPTYFPEPAKFDPERFGPDVFQKPCAFLPFGEGPRICLAMRFALQEMKFCLAKMLISYSLKLNRKTKEPLVFNKKTFFTTPQDPVYYDLEKVAL
ncbi:probable cytochrome P450 6a14 isoform X2 [Cimex lectularius]|uniref:Cytochrome P450 n=1 Tax=Cimex lectularius TaxID=79782 RepID=A0A8I6SDT6_CIMLE|nr:probable cytochrome P450 6a14 isoform X2 [Cimex lectularius]